MEKNDIVQITDPDHPWFPCLMVVDEVKSWGVQAFCFVPNSNDGTERPRQAYNRLKSEAIEVVGRCVIVEKDDENV